MTDLSGRFREALVYAAELHAGQTRKGEPGIPYMSHLLAVASIVLEHGASEDEAIAALLHDAIEDQGGAATRAEIRRRFGDGVAAIADGCSDSDEVPKPPWRERKEAYIEHLRHAGRSVSLVSAADKLHNARAIRGDLRRIGDGLWQRFNGGKQGTLWYYRSLVQVLREAGSVPKPLVDELEVTVADIERLAAS